MVVFKAERRGRAILFRWVRFILFKDSYQTSPISLARISSLLQQRSLGKLILNCILCCHCKIGFYWQQESGQGNKKRSHGDCLQAMLAARCVGPAQHNVRVGALKLTNREKVMMKMVMICLNPVWLYQEHKCFIIRLHEI